jgi:hypothetical protein
MSAQRSGFRIESQNVTPTELAATPTKEMSMRVQGAVIREQGLTFAVVIVKPHAVQTPAAAEEAIRAFTPIFGVPVVLMAQDSRGTPTYRGRPDIARFMASVPLQAVQWKEYTIN